MAEDVKKLLIKLGISTKDLQTAVKEIKGKFADLQGQLKKDHEDKVKQANAEIALEKKKQEQAKQGLAVIDKQIETTKKLINLASKNPEQTKQLIQQEKILLSVKDAQIKVLERSPQFQNVSLANLKKEVDQEKAKLNLIEQQTKLKMAGAVGKMPSTTTGATATAAVSSAPARLMQLENQLKSVEYRSQTANIRSEMEAQTNAYRAGEITLQQYIDNEGLQLKKLHDLRMQMIQTERDAQIKSVEEQVKAGKMLSDEAQARTKVIEAQAKAQVDAQNVAYRQQTNRLATTPALPSFSDQSALRAQALREQLRSMNQKGISADLKLEMQDLETAYRNGTIKIEEYIKQATRVAQESAKLRIDAIYAEEAAKKNQINTEYQLGKISVDEQKLRTQIAVRETDMRIKMAQREQQAVISAIQRQSAVEGRGSFAESGLGKTMNFISMMTPLGGLPVQMMAAVTAGNLLTSVIEKLGETIKRELYRAGPEIQLSQQFEKLAKRAGDDPAELINRMKDATHHLTDEMVLYKVANNFMQSGMKISGDQIVELTRLTTGLSRAQGRDATEAMNRLVRASITGRTAMLGMSVGISRTQLALKGVPATMDATTRATLETAHTIEVMKKRYEEIGEPAYTYAELVKMQNVAVEQMFNSFATGISKAQPFQDFIDNSAKRIAQLSNKVNELAERLGTDFGEAFVIVQPILDTFTDTLTMLRDIVISATNAVKAIVHDVASLVGSFSGTDKGLTSFIDRLFTLRGALGVIAGMFVVLDTIIKQIGADAKLAGALVVSAFTADLKMATQAVKDWNEQNKKILDDAEQHFEKLANFITQPSKPIEQPAAGEHKQDEETIQYRLRMAKLQLQIEQALIKEQLQTRTLAIAAEQHMLQDSYERGLIDYQEYIAKRKTLSHQEHQAKIDEIEAERKAKIKELGLEQTAKTQSLTAALTNKDLKPDQRASLSVEAGRVGGEFAKRRELININARMEVAKELDAEKKEMESFDDELYKDRLSARQKYIDEANKLEQQGVKYREKLLEEEFKKGELDAAEYIAQKKDIVNQEYMIAVNAAIQKYDVGKKTATDQAELETSLLAEEIKREEGLTEIIQKEDDTRLQSMKNRYDQAKGLIESEMKLSQDPALRGLSAFGNDTEGVKALQDITDLHLKNLYDEMQRIVDSGEAYGDQWIKIRQEIIDATLQQSKLNDEMLKSKDVFSPLGKLFNSIGSSFGGVSKTLQDVMSRTGNQFEAISQYRQGVGKDMSGNPFKDMITAFKGLWGTTQKKNEEAAQAIQRLSNSVSSSVGQFNQLQQSSFGISGAFQTTVTQLDIFRGALDGASTRLAYLGTGKTPPGAAGPQEGAMGGAFETAPFAGAIPGLFGGGASDPIQQTIKQIMGLGDASAKVTKGTEGFGTRLGKFTEVIGSAIGAVGNLVNAFSGAKSGGQGALSGGLAGMSTGAMFGPWGAAIGGVGGAIAGGLFGHKQADVDKELKKIDNMFKATTQALNDGAMNLNQAFAQMASLRQNAIDTLSSSKKGRKALPAVMDEANQQLIAIIQRQRAVMTDLHNQIKMLSEPTQYREFTSSIETIVKKYQDFAGAAQNARDLALANQYLVQSLQEYVATEKRELAGAEQDAIQNALQLNQLLDDRNQLDQDYIKQKQDIMGRGNVRRMTSESQQKAYDLQQLDKNYQKQRQSMDQQIAVAQTRFDVEKNIFGLSQNRTALETRLIELQQAQTTYDMQRIQALNDVITRLGGMDLSKINGIDQIYGALGMPVPPGTEDYLSKGARYKPELTDLVKNKAYIFYQQQGSYDIYKPWTANAAEANNPANWLLVGPDGSITPYYGAYGGGGGGTGIPGAYAGNNGGGGSAGGGGRVGARMYASGGDMKPGEMAIVGERGPEPVINLGNGIMRVIPNRVASVVGNVLQDTQVSIENKINDVASKRMQMELTIIKAKDAHAVNDIMRMQKMISLLQEIQRTGGASGDLELQLQRLYGVRGRYGAGGFTREYL